MLDGTLMFILVNLSVVDIIHLQSNKFVMGVKIKATGDSKLSDSPAGDFKERTLTHNFNLISKFIMNGF